MSWLLTDLAKGSVRRIGKIGATTPPASLVLKIVAALICGEIVGISSTMPSSGGGIFVQKVRTGSR
jgi:hypothetical protein